MASRRSWVRIPSAPPTYLVSITYSILDGTITEKLAKTPSVDVTWFCQLESGSEAGWVKPDDDTQKLFLAKISSVPK